MGAPQAIRGAPRGNIIIIGAGMSGLAAAQGLRTRGFEVTILEGRDRIGGRIRTERVGGRVVELGAQWIEGIRNNPIYEICRAENLRMVKDKWNFQAYGPDGKPVGDREARSLYAEAEKAVRITRRLARKMAKNGEKDIYLSEALARTKMGAGKTDTRKKIMDWAVNWEYGSDWAEETSRISLQSYWADEPEGNIYGSTMYLPEGYDQVLRILAGDINIITGVRVNEINYSGREVVLKTNDGNYRAATVLVTIPLGILKSGLVRFYPDLPLRKRTAIQGLRMGVANKAVLFFHKPFWPDVNYLGYAPGAQGQYVEWTNLNKFSGFPALSVWSHGNYARMQEALSRKETVGRLMEVIRKIFGNSVPNPAHWIVSKWMSDTFSGGSYTNVPMGGVYGNYDILAEPVADKVFFAGEATERTFPGTVHGAFISGIREARRISSDA